MLGCSQHEYTAAAGYSCVPLYAFDFVVAGASNEWDLCASVFQQGHLDSGAFSVGGQQALDSVVCGAIGCASSHSAKYCLLGLAVCGTDTSIKQV